MQYPASFRQPPHRVLPFHWIFPVGQLVVCVMLVSIVVEMGGRLSYGHTARILQAIAVLDLPGGLIQLPIETLRPGKTEWRPAWIDFRMRRALTWPILGMVFWWIAGRATEALAALGYRQLSPKINWVETITGFLVMAGGAVIFCGMLIGLASGEMDSIAIDLAAAGGLWTLLGSLSVVARFRQSRLRKKTPAL
jgi:hypothetical protein